MLPFCKFSAALNERNDYKECKACLEQFKEAMQRVRNSNSNSLFISNNPRCKIEKIILGNFLIYCFFMPYLSSCKTGCFFLFNLMILFKLWLMYMYMICNRVCSAVLQIALASGLTL